MRIIDSRSPTNPLVAIGGDLRASLILDPTLPEAINRLTVALERAEHAGAYSSADDQLTSASTLRSGRA
jgi:hypothetical protein